MSAQQLTFGSLFAGIGGIDLGLERAGMRCVWQVEIDDYCQRVLAKHWPNVKRYKDVRDVGQHNLESVDLICGGFPCQDISEAGRGAGLAGARSGLWFEFDRIIRILRPRYVLVENVAGLLVRGMGTVLGDLARSGYNAEWQMLPAAAFGAPHIRQRVFIVAHAQSVIHQRNGWAMARAQKESSLQINGTEFNRSGKDRRGPRRWDVEPAVGRMVDGLPSELDKARLKALGNAVVPQVAEWIGRQILDNDTKNSV
jgi:DNA (cytosine-5)-methyltransferase 1